MAPYAALYACIGAYGRTLLDSGEAVDKVFEDLGVVVGKDVEMGEEGLLAAGLFVLYGVWRPAPDDYYAAERFGLIAIAIRICTNDTVSITRPRRRTRA